MMPNFQVGETVVLKKESDGKGRRTRRFRERSRFFYTKAIVVESSSSSGSGWALKVQPLLEGASPMLWMKKFVVTTKGRLDPNKILDKRTMINIFSFLVEGGCCKIGSNTTLQQQRDGCQALRTLSAVSTGWRAIAREGRNDPAKVLDKTNKIMQHIFSFVAGTNGSPSESFEAVRNLIAVSPGWKQILMEGRKDPSQIFDNFVMARIFSFLGNGGDGAAAAAGRRTAASKVDRYHDSLGRAVLLESKLSGVCNSWRQIYIAHAAPILGLIWIDLLRVTTTSKKKTRIQIEWMCKRKIRLEMIRYYPQQDEISILQRILRQCDTSQLKYAAVGAAASIIGNGTFHSRMRRDESILLDQKGLHDVLAHECPKLESLVLACYLCPERGSSYNQSLSKSPLFVMPSIKNIALIFRYTGPVFRETHPLEPEAIFSLFMEGLHTSAAGRRHRLRRAWVTLDRNDFNDRVCRLDKVHTTWETIAWLLK